METAVDFIDALTTMTTAALRAAARALNAGDSPTLARLEIHDVLDLHATEMDPELRGATERHLAAVLEAFFANRSKGQGS